eukprot:3351593-Amphidinium_carterae.1
MCKDSVVSIENPVVQCQPTSFTHHPFILNSAIVEDRYFISPSDISSKLLKVCHELYSMIDHLSLLSMKMLRPFRQQQLYRHHRLPRQHRHGKD